MMRVSIALCTYNGQRFLREQLDSLLAQTRQPHEMVVVDDASSDRTLLMLNEFARTAPFEVRVIQNERNLGSSQSFEKAIGMCTGDIVFLCDQDDIWHPDKLDALSKDLAADTEVSVVFSDADLVDEKGRYMGRRLWETLFWKHESHSDLVAEGLPALLFKRNFVTGAAMAFRSGMIPIVAQHPVPEAMVHDYWIAILAALFSKLKRVDRVTIKYRQHSDQQIGVAASAPIWTGLNDRTSSYDEMVRGYASQIDAYLLLLDRHDWSGEKKELLDRKVADLREKKLHLRARTSLPSNRIARVMTVMRELSAGRYSKHSSGLRSALLDLFRRHASSLRK